MLVTKPATRCKLYRSVGDNQRRSHVQERINRGLQDILSFYAVQEQNCRDMQTPRCPPSPESNEKEPVYDITVRCGPKIRIPPDNITS